MSDGGLPPFRSLLFVPGHKPEWVLKALRVPPDAVILDLEDAVPHDGKPAARGALADSIRALRDAGVGVVVRPNGWSTEHGPADLDAVVPAAPDALLVPKVDTEVEMVRLDAVIAHLERRAGLTPGGIAVIASLESASGLDRASRIAAAPRVAGVVAAAARNGDTARSVGFRWSAEGLETLAWRTSAVVACRAAGGQPFVGLWQEIHDLDGLRRFAAANRAIGFAGQTVIHPSHVEPVNEAFGPTEEDVAYYEGLLEAVAEAERTGSGAVVYRGEHVDAAHVATARAIVEQARAAGHPSLD